VAHDANPRLIGEHPGGEHSGHDEERDDFKTSNPSIHLISFGVSERVPS
jgi:hypothetical protein